LLRQLLELTPWTVPSSLICLAPLAAGLLFAQMQAHRFAAFAEIKAMMTTGMLPILRRMSWWVRPGTHGIVQLTRHAMRWGGMKAIGLRFQSRGLLALGFGVGEELLFRGVLQPSISRMSQHEVRAQYAPMLHKTLSGTN